MRIAAMALSGCPKIFAQWKPPCIEKQKLIATEQQSTYLEHGMIYRQANPLPWPRRPLTPQEGLRRGP